MIIYFKQEGQSLQYYKSPVTLAQNSRNYLVAAFLLSEEWQAYTVSASFEKDDEVYHILLDSENCCALPSEILDKSDFDLSLIAVSKEDATVRATTNRLRIALEKGPCLVAENSSAPTATEMEQALSYLALARELAQTVRDDADNGVFDGTDGVNATQIVVCNSENAITAAAKNCTGTGFYLIWSGRKDCSYNMGFSSYTFTCGDLCYIYVSGQSATKSDYMGNIRGPQYTLTDEDKSSIVEAVLSALGAEA